MSVYISLEAPVGATPDHVPRMGFNLALVKTLRRVKWCGRGPGESYPDKQNSQRLGVWGVDDISQLNYSYDVPQENGNHTDTRWLEIGSEEQGPTVKVTAIGSQFPFDCIKDAEVGNRTSHCPVSHDKASSQKLFNFTATTYSVDVLEKAAHPGDLVEGDHTLLSLDAAVSGVGTAAVGPGPREDHLVKPKEATFGFMIALA